MYYRLKLIKKLKGAGVKINFSILNIIDKSFELEVIKALKDFETIPLNFLKDSCLLEICLKNRELENYIFHFFEPAWTDKLILKYSDYIINMMINNNHIPEFLKNNSLLFSKFLVSDFDKRYITIFSIDLWEKDIIEKNEKVLVEILKKNDRSNWHMKINPYLLDLCFKYDLDDEIICSFLSKAWTNEIIKNNKIKIINLFNRIRNVPVAFRDSINLLRFCLENNIDDLILDFNFEFLTDIEIMQYQEKILDLIIYKKTIPEGLESNSYILAKCIECKVGADLVFSFESSAWNNEIVSINKTYIIKILRKLDYFPNSLCDNSVILDLCLKKNMDYNKFWYFNSDAWDGIDLKKYKNKIKRIIKRKDNVPNSLSKNSYVLLICLEEELSVRIISQFSNTIFTDSFIYYNKIKIIDYIKKTGIIPSNLKNNFRLLKILINDINFAIQFSLNIWTDELINEYAFNFVDGVVKNKLIDKVDFKSDYNMMIQLLDYCLKTRQYDALDDFFDYKKYDISKKEKIIKKYKNIILLNRRFLRLANPLTVTILSGLDNNELIKIVRDQEVQSEILSLNNKKILLIEKIIILLQQEKNLDVTPIIYKVIMSINKYGKMIDELDIDSINIEQLSNLIYILVNETDQNLFNNLDDLNSSSLKDKEEVYYEYVNGLIENGNIDAKTLRYAILLKRYKLSKACCDFIYDRYCSKINIEQIKKNKNSESLENILLQIYDIYNTSDINILIEMFKKSDNELKVDFKTSFVLESKIREMFAKKYESTLYKINKNDHLTVTSRNFNKDRLLELQKDGFDIYIPTEDFSMQIHTLNAFAREQGINNYNDNWNSSDLYNHGVCTCYIRNDQIAPAHESNPILGFDNLKGVGFLLSGVTDLYTNNVNYAVSSSQPGLFLYPDAMINNTRHYNEQVRERLTIKNGQYIKDKPAYVVYIVDDINNAVNFMSTTKIDSKVNFSQINYFAEVKKCAKEMNLPIVIIDRLYYAKRERIKCDLLLEQFKSTLNLNLLNELFVKIFNNLVGCISELNKQKEYSLLFSEEVFNEYLAEVINYACDQIEEEQVEIFRRLIEILKNEFNVSNTELYGPNLNNLFKSIIGLEQLIEEINDFKILKKTM